MLALWSIFYWPISIYGIALYWSLRFNGAVSAIHKGHKSSKYKFFLPLNIIGLNPINILLPNSILVALYPQTASLVKIFSKVVSFVMTTPWLCYSLYVALKINESSFWNKYHFLQSLVSFFDYILFPTFLVQWVGCLSDEDIFSIKFRCFIFFP